MKRFIKSIAIVLTFAVIVAGLAPASVEAKKKKSKTYYAGGTYTFYNKKLEEKYYLDITQFSSPEIGRTTIGYVDLTYKDGTGEKILGRNLKTHVRRWPLKKTKKKNVYKAKKLTITVYKKKVKISGKHAKECGFRGTYKLKKRFIP